MLTGLPSIIAVLLENGYSLEALPVIAVLEWLAQHIQADLPATVAVRLQRVQALTQLGLLADAASLLGALIVVHSSAVAVLLLLLSVCLQPYAADLDNMRPWGTAQKLFVPAFAFKALVFKSAMTMWHVRFCTVLMYHNCCITVGILGVLHGRQNVQYASNQQLQHTCRGKGCLIWLGPQRALFALQTAPCSRLSQCRHSIVQSFQVVPQYLKPCSRVTLTSPKQ